jgi:hypothetical protein
MFLPSSLGLLFCDRFEGELRRVRAGIFSLWVPADALAYSNKWFEVLRVLAHELNDILADLLVFVLVSVNLIREGIKETIACRRRMHISFYRSNYVELGEMQRSVWSRGLTITANFTGFQALSCQLGEFLL